ncbi:hypothetical protein EJB05_21018, partial [Eragrostis curvula]
MRALAARQRLAGYDCSSRSRGPDHPLRPFILHNLLVNSSATNGCRLVPHAGGHGHGHGGHVSHQVAASRAPPPPWSRSTATTSSSRAKIKNTPAAAASLPRAVDDDDDDDVWGGLLQSEPPGAGLLQDALHDFYPSTRPPRGGTCHHKPDAGIGAAAASPYGADDFDYEDGGGDYPMTPQGLLGDVIQFPAFVQFVGAAPPAAPFRGRRG